MLFRLETTKKHDREHYQPSNPTSLILSYEYEDPRTKTFVPMKDEPSCFVLNSSPS